MYLGWNLSAYNKLIFSRRKSKMKIFNHLIENNIHFEQMQVCNKFSFRIKNPIFYVTVTVKIIMRARILLLLAAAFAIVSALLQRPLIFGDIEN